jgi:hypothetical protein
MRTCNYSSIFQEAINHCRWKKTLHNLLKDIDISSYENKTFEEIICYIYDMCQCVKGIGLLTMYDITASICRYYNINIEKVYIIGNGPKRAVKLLNLETKTHIINNKIKLNYVCINDIIMAFNNNCYELDESLTNVKNGDIFETYICNWQKTQININPNI